MHGKVEIVRVMVTYYGMYVRIAVDNVVTVDIFNVVLVGVVWVLFSVVAYGGKPIILDIGVGEKAFFDRFSKGCYAECVIVMVIVWAIIITIASRSFCSSVEKCICADVL